MKLEFYILQLFSKWCQREKHKDKDKEKERMRIKNKKVAKDDYNFKHTFNIHHSQNTQINFTFKYLFILKFNSNVLLFSGRNNIYRTYSIWPKNSVASKAKIQMKNFEQQTK